MEVYQTILADDGLIWVQVEGIGTGICVIHDSHGENWWGGMDDVLECFVCFRADIGIVFRMLVLLWLNISTI